MNPPRYSRMAVDFGTSNTIVAFWNEDTQEVDLHTVADVTLPFCFTQDGTEIKIPYIPSMIHYQDAHTSFIGSQVIDKMVEKSRGSFRWLKAFIQERRPIRQTLDDGTAVDYFKAGRDFLEKVLAFAAQSGQVDLSSCEVAFTAPVEAFEHYTEWLAATCADLGVRRYRFIDESSACIFGYDTHLQPGDMFLIFDFGGGTLDVSVVQMQARIHQGLGCRVMGKAGCRVGGRSIDGWLYAELLRRARLHAVDARQASALFLRGVEQIKEKLSDHHVWQYDLKHPQNGLRLEGALNRSELEDLLDRHHLNTDVIQTIERALKDADQHGASRDDIKEALLVGGASQMPYVRRLVSNLFGKRTRHFRPYDAVARGACRFLSSQVESLYDYIQHDYAIKGYSPQTGTTVFTPLVPRCTAYPTAPDFKKMTLKATRDGQRFFGVDIYEIAEKSIRGGIAGNGIVFTPDGAAVFENGESFAAADTEFWINEGNPTFIEADPPAQRGVKRFALTFRVDSQKHLRVTVRDILTQKLKYDDYPVVKLK